LDSVLPALGWDLAGFFMDPLFVIEGDELVEELLGFGAVCDLVFFTEKGKASLKVVKDFFDLSFGLGLAFPGIDHADIEVLEGTSELDFSFIFTKLISDMNALMKDETEDRVIVQVVSQREAVGDEGLPDDLKVLEGGLVANDPGPDDGSAMIILGQDEIVFGSGRGEPEMVGGVVLKEGAWAGGLEAGIDLPLFVREGMIIPLT
jgi:hypothetical protein